MCTHCFGYDRLYRTLVEPVQFVESRGQIFLCCCDVRRQLIHERSIYIERRLRQVILFEILIELDRVGLDLLCKSDDATSSHA